MNTPACPTGYSHPLYAASLAGFGTPVPLPRSGGWILRRGVRGEDLGDATGCYPLFSCPNWPGLASDLEELGDDLVSLAVVADPFGEYDLAYLRRCFPDRVLPFKEHYVIDLASSALDSICRHHRRYIRASLGKVRVELCVPPEDQAETWCGLYQDFVAKRQVKGIRAFSPHAFSVQLRTPGIVMFRALAGDRVVGAHLWYAQGEVCHSHLTVCSDEGRRLRAAFALHWSAVEHFQGRFKWLNLGGGAGIRPSRDDGLVRFKRGWSGMTRMAYFCGRILNRRKYEALVGARAGNDTDYFPGYRVGEFA